MKTYRGRSFCGSNKFFLRALWLIPVLWFLAGTSAHAATTSTPPQSLTATSTNMSVSLSWLAPSSNGSSSLTQYDILNRFTGSSTFVQVATTSALQTTSTIAGLANGQSYDFEIIAENGVGSSSPSNIVSSTPFTVPGSPTGVSASVGFAQASVITLAGVASTTCTTTDGLGSAARICSPKAMSVDSSGNAYTVDFSGNRIRKITPAGLATTYAGSGGFGSNNGPSSTATFYNPSGSAVDSAGNVYIADTNNCEVRKISAIDQSVSTVVGTSTACTGSSSEIDGPSSTARLSKPAGIAVDSLGNIYIDSYAGCTLRKISPTGTVATIAGLAYTCGEADGTGTVARFNNPSGIAADSNNNVYVADETGCTIRKITPAGVVSTLAGSPNHCGYADGTGSAAQFHVPSWTTVDSLGNVYATDYLNYVIREITQDGVVTTLAGLGGTIGSSDGTGYAAEFNHPDGLAVDSSGNIYISDRSNNTVRRATLNTAASIVVSFSAPTSTGGSPITGYTVVSSPAGGVDSNAGSTSTIHTITGLTNDGVTAYTFTAIATNAAGSSASSTPSNNVLATLPPYVPRSVSALGANNAVDVSWAAPSFNGGVPITSYLVYDRLAGASSFALAATTAQTSVSVGNLAGGQSYDFQVRAVNSVGNSSPTLPVTAWVAPVVGVGGGTVSGGSFSIPPSSPAISPVITSSSTLAPAAASSAPAATSSISLQVSSSVNLMVPSLSDAASELAALRRQLMNLLAAAGISGAGQTQGVSGSSFGAFTVVASNLEYRDRGPEVRTLQAALVAQGFLFADPNGIFGPLTLRAVRAFQSAHDIPRTGYVGPLTRHALFGAQ